MAAPPAKRVKNAEVPTPRYTNQYKDELIATARAIATRGKGILAADESTGTIGKRLASINVENTTENARKYRQQLFLTKGWGEYCSGCILFEETLYQKTDDGVPFVDVINKEGVVVGIKVDKGTRVMPFTEGLNEAPAKYCQGLTDLDKRVAKYYAAGARFAKWRAVLQIQNGAIPQASIQENAWTLARYAAICQAGGLVPIVEPEILMDGDHSLATSQFWTTKVLVACYKALRDQNVMLEGTLLKPNMVLAGKQNKDKKSFDDNALACVTALRNGVPASMPGIVFLSGGQSEEEATNNLNAINKYDLPWTASFSFGRALQASVLKAWQGKEENIPAAQTAFLKRCKANSMAQWGKYDGFAADENSKGTLYEKGYTY